MKSSILCATLLCAVSQTTLAQASSSAAQSFPAVISNGTATPAPALGPTIVPRAERTALMVMNFESGTVSAHVKDKRGLSAILAAMRGDNTNEHYDPAQLGTGIADMLVDKLLETGQFRLMERKALESVISEQKINAGAVVTPEVAVASNASVLGAQYMVTGSVTKFGFEEHNIGGFAANMATMGMLGYRKHRTEVKLTARVVNTATGEIIASVNAEGVSNKGGGLRIFGMGANGGGGGGSDKKNFKESAIGHATERAVNHFVEKLVAKRATF